MPKVLDHPEVLQDLLDDLRRNDYKIGMDQYADVQNLVLALFAQDRLPEDLRDLEPLLAPLLCTNADEQAQFEMDFFNWLARQGLPSDAPDPIKPSHGETPPSPTDPPVEPDDPTPLVPRYKRRGFLAALTILLMLTGTGLLWWVLAWPPVWVLQGTVHLVDAQPVPDVVIDITGPWSLSQTQPLRTDANGAFAMKGLFPDGTVRLRLAPVGYVRIDTTLTLADLGKAGIQLTLEQPPLLDLRDNLRGNLENLLLSIENALAVTTDSTAFVDLKTDTEGLLARLETDADLADLQQEYQILLERFAALEAATPAARLQELVDRINTFSANYNQDQHEQRLAARSLWRKLNDDYMDVLRGILSGLLLLAWPVWLWWRRQQTSVLNKDWAEPETKQKSVRVKGPNEVLFQGRAWRYALQALSHRRTAPGRDLDGNATVLASARAGGLFVPVTEVRLLAAEYLVLIDETSIRDQQARWLDEMVHRLADNGIYVDLYYFEGDLRTCYTRDPLTHARGRQHSLEALARLHPDHRLLLFSDGAGLSSPFTGLPYPWMHRLDPWPVRALFTPEQPRRWGYREMALGQEGLGVFPATALGMAAFGLSLHTAIEPDLEDPDARPLPLRLETRPQYWIGQIEPPKGEVKNLLDELALYLGPAGFYWLQACAVYPALHWHLTLYLGEQLTHQGQPLLDENRLLALARLPWFREGILPDWLRELLIERLDDAQEGAVRDALNALLNSVQQRPPIGFDLEIAAQNKLWPRAAQPPLDSALREHVFLQFMRGHQPLALKAPDWLRRLLFKEDEAGLWVRPLWFGVVAALGILILWLLPATTPTDLPLEILPRFGLVETAANAVVPLPFSRSDSTLAYYVGNQEQAGLPGITRTALQNNQAVADQYVVQLQQQFEDSLNAALPAAEAFVLAWDTTTLAPQQARLYLGLALPPDTTLPLQAPAILNLTYQPQNPTIGQPVQFSATVAGTPPFNYLWDFGDGATETTLATNHVFTTVGSYLVTLRVVNQTETIADSVMVVVADPTNRNPIGVVDSVSVPMNGSATFNVLANDRDPDGDPLSVVSVTAPTYGNVQDNADGTLTYATKPGFSGIDTLRYRIRDGRGGVATAPVRVSVFPPPDSIDVIIYYVTGLKFIATRLEAGLRELGSNVIDVEDWTHAKESDDRELSYYTYGNNALHYGSDVEYWARSIRDSLRQSLPSFALDVALKAGDVIVPESEWSVGPRFMYVLIVRAREIQRRLQSLGYYGFQGIAFFGALDAFQRDFNITTEIGIGPNTLDQLLQLPSTWTNSLGMAFRVIPKGDFQMGSTDGDSNERPVHGVTISMPFYMGEHEVTQGQFRAFVDSTSYRTEAEQGDGCVVLEGDSVTQQAGASWENTFVGEDRPVVCVSWNDAQAFVRWLNEQEEGGRYRLPTEAEWEYAAKSGTDYRYAGTDSEDALCRYANVADASARRTNPGWTTVSCDDGYVEPAPIGQFQPNAWQLHDMTGNVWEWVEDWLASYSSNAETDPAGPGTGSSRVIRGGSWVSTAGIARSAYRSGAPPVYRDGYLGFRLVRTAR